MGRDDHNRKLHNRNDPQLPQTPANDVSYGKDDAELAEEVDELYNFEITPALGITDIERKETDEK